MENETAIKMRNKDVNIFQGRTNYSNICEWVLPLGIISLILNLYVILKVKRSSTMYGDMNNFPLQDILMYSRSNSYVTDQRKNCIKERTITINEVSCSGWYIRKYFFFVISTQINKNRSLSAKYWYLISKFYLPPTWGYVFF